MNDSNFLKAIVAFYNSEHSTASKHEDVVYVVPNKRSGAFLKKYVQQQMLAIGRMPRFMTIRSFMNEISAIPEGAERELRYILYNSYRNVLEAHGNTEGGRDFDSFLFWGDIILSDYNEIDRNLLPATLLYKNLNDLKEIQADYLDEEQKKIVRRIWGDSRLTSETERFWLHTSPEQDSLSGHFTYLWQILGELYQEFHKQLTLRGISTPGGQYKIAVDNIDDFICDKENDSTRFAFVGFNDLSVAESIIFHKLASAGLADFFWDLSPIIMAEEQRIPALDRLSSLSQEFPMPTGFEQPLPSHSPQIKLLSIPSAIAQAKAAGDVLRNLEFSDPPALEIRNAINTAVVIPDQNQLIPLMFSIPDEFEAVNISMGLHFKSTSFAALLQAVVRMQQRARMLHGELHFFSPDIVAVLNQPHVRLIDADSAEEIIKFLSDKRKFNISIRELTDEFPNFQPLFRQVPDNIRGAANYLLDFFSWLISSLNDRGVNSLFEESLLEKFSAEIVALADGAEEFGITMNDRTFLRLFRRLLEHTSLNLEGTPLAGLQLLGVLETRALDFDNVIILSMNEGVFPRRQYSKTMIPAALRHGYGLPDQDSLEETYAYCFYRLIARAKNVTLIYDSRSGKTGSGEMSRYISQLHHLVKNANITFEDVNIMGLASQTTNLEINKSGEVLKHLNRFRSGGNRYLSATAIRDYIGCQLRFYLQFIRGMRGSDELVDYMNAAEQGTLIHNTIQYIYRSLTEKCISAATFDRLLDVNDRTIAEACETCLLSLARYKSYASRKDKLPTEAKIMLKLLQSIVRADLEAERDFYCSDGRVFTFIENEAPVKQGGWEINPNLSVNWRMNIDRVDKQEGRLRFIDFKTGSDSLEAPTFESLFSGDHKMGGMLQILAYCETYRALIDSHARIQPVIQAVIKLSGQNPITPLMIGNHAIEEYTPDIAAEFAPLLKAIVAEIFDESIPFRATVDNNNCKFCNFKDLCGRSEPENYGKS